VISPRLVLAAWLMLTPAAVLAQTKGDAKADPCARFTEPDKRDLCKAKERRAARDAERKKVDVERRVERKCATQKDDKARAECEKKELAKPKG
jgi:hypothetical protein